MAAGDIIIPDNTITPELLDKIAAEVQNRILSTSKDPGQYEEVDSLTGVTSIPVFQQSGSTYKLVRVLLSILKGVDGKEVHLQSTETHLQWRWTDGMWNNLIALADLKGDPGDTPIFRTGSSGIEWKYVSEDETGWKVLVTFEVLKLKFIDLTAEQIAAFWQAIPEDVLILFQKPATDAAAEVREQMAQISQNVSQAITETNTAKQGAIEATVNAKSVSDHPGYIGSDYHVYTWDYVTGAYIQTDVVLRPEGFSIYRSYPSIAKMNEDLANVPEGKFVLINTNDVEQGDNAKMYVRGATSFEYLVDMSGAIGFTGKTPQFSIGLVSKGESPSATISEDGIDAGGNPKYKLNLVLPKGDPGTDGKTPVFEIDSVSTGEPGTDVSVTLTPNGQTAEGNPIYKLSISIPRGQQGLPGEGSGNVSADGAGLVLGKKYLFVPNADGSTSGTFVEYVPHTSYMLVFGANKAIPADAFAQISNAFNTGGEVLVKFTDGSVYKPGSIDISGNVATLKMFNFGNDYITIEVTNGVTTAEMYSNKVVIDADITKKIEVHNISPDAHQDIRQKITEVEAIARGRAKAIVFNTVADLDAWLSAPGSVEMLHIGDNLYIRELNVPDYWWDGTEKQPLEGEKVDLSGYVEEAPSDDKQYARKNKTWVESSMDLSKENVESVLTGDITTHTHDDVYAIGEMPTDVWDGVTISTSLDGSGTVDDPYLVQSCADWFHLNLEGAKYGDVPNPEGNDGISKFIKITKNLDFNNKEFQYPDIINDTTAASNSLLSLASIDGQGSVFSNLNLLWGSISLQHLYCFMRGINIIDSVFTIDISFFDAGGFAIFSGLSNEATQYDFNYNCSCQAEYKITGSITEETVLSLIGLIGGTTVDGNTAGFYFGGIKFTNQVNTDTFPLTCMYVPVYPHNPNSAVTAYDYSATVAMPSMAASGFYPVMIHIDSILYYNSDNAATPVKMDDTATTNPIPKTTAEMKSPEFLALLNGETDTFTADTNNINNGYPVFASNTLIYDGYVRNSEFKKFKNNIPSDIYDLDIDFLGAISKINVSDQIRLFGKAYTAPTSDNILDLLGGVNGVKKLRGVINATSSFVISIPTLTYVISHRLVSIFATSILLDNKGSAKDIDALIEDGDRIQFTINFLGPTVNDYSLTVWEVVIEIDKFNTSEQIVEYRLRSHLTIQPIDDLNSRSSTFVLSANQGRILNEKIKDALVLKNITTATSLSSLPIANYSIKVTLSAASALSFSSTPYEGWECMIDIKNTGSSNITQPLPNATGWQSDEASMTIAAGKIASISVRYVHGVYVVVSKGN